MAITTRICVALLVAAVGVLCVLVLVFGGTKLVDFALRHFFIQRIHTTVADTCGPYGFSCTGCTSLTLCETGTNLTCHQGYCDENSPEMCVGDPPETCEAISSLCTTERGRFAIPCTGCTKYKLCPHGYTMICPVGTQFDPKLQSCTSEYRCQEQGCVLTNDCNDLGQVPVTCTGCTKYTACALLERTNTFIKFQLECPEGTHYDPERLTCTREYKCTERMLEKNPVPNTCCKKYSMCVPYGNVPKLLEGTCIQPMSFDPDVRVCSPTYKCDEMCESNYNYIESSTTPYANITNEPVTQLISSRKISEVPTCAREGKVPVPCTGCTEYTLCVHLADGSFRENRAKCPKSTHFDPQLQKCTVAYKCVETENCEPECIEKLPHERDCSKFYCGKMVESCPTGTNFNPDARECSANYQCGTVSPTCSVRGKYPVVNNCTGYYLCNAGMELVSRSCPSGTGFHPVSLQCENGYTCDTEQQVSIKPATEGIFQCQKFGRFPVPDTGCTKYYYCPPASVNAYTYACPTGYLFDPALQTCSGTYICPELDITCTTVGLYPIPGTECKQYAVCTLSADKQLVSVRGTCPDGTLFHPVFQSCRDNYICTGVTTTTPSPGTPPFKCEAFGRFPIPNSDCTKYYYCNVVYVFYVYQCPTGTFFDPNLQTCTVSYVCPANPLTCSTVGMFPVAGTTCQDYFFCIENPNDVLSGPHFDTCPLTTLFNPISQNCEPDYVCANARKRRDVNFNTIACDSIGTYPVPHTNCTDFYFCNVGPDGEFIPAVIESCPMHEKFNPALQTCQTDFQCSCVSIGKFVVPRTNCTEYFACGPDFAYVKFSCPSGTRFDPLKQKCDVHYACMEDRCESIGKYPVKGTSCKGYFVCNQDLQMSALMKCGDGTLFNPKVQKCERAYVCPEKKLVPEMYVNGWWWNY